MPCRNFFPGQLFRCLQAAVADEASLPVYPIRFAVEDGGAGSVPAYMAENRMECTGPSNRSPAFRKTI